MYDALSTLCTAVFDAAYAGLDEKLADRPRRLLHPAFL
jgi:hypothetical protein